MRYVKSKQVHPIEQFGRFDVPDLDMSCDGVVLVRSPVAKIVWFPGCTGPRDLIGHSSYYPVRLYAIVKDSMGPGTLAIKLSGCGRFNQTRYRRLLKAMYLYLSAEVAIDDIDVSRKKFTTVFE